MRPEDTKAKTSRSAGSQRAQDRPAGQRRSLSASRRCRSRSIAIMTASSMSWSRNGLVRKSTAPPFMALTRHRNVAMAGHEDDRYMNVRLGEFGLKVQAAQSGQPDVQDQAARDIRKLALQHFGGRAEQLNLQSDRLKKVAEGSAHRYVVLDNEDDRFPGACRDWRRFWAFRHNASPWCEGRTN